MPDNKTHHFNLSFKLDNINDPAWIGVGFSQDNMMGFDNVVLCKNSPRDTSALHYFTQGHIAPGLLDSRNPGVGISNAQVSKNNQHFLCSFNRDKFVPNTENYYDLSKRLHLLAATGPLSNDGDIFQHDFKMSSDSPIDFATELGSKSIINSNSNSSSRAAKVRTHGN